MGMLSLRDAGKTSAVQLHIGIHTEQAGSGPGSGSGACCTDYPMQIFSELTLSLSLVLWVVLMDCSSSSIVESDQVTECHSCANKFQLLYFEVPGKATTKQDGRTYIGIAGQVFGWLDKYLGGWAKVSIKDATGAQESIKE